MNVDNIFALAAHLRKPEIAEHFDLGDWVEATNATDEQLLEPVSSGIHICGTVACIAGHAAFLAYPNTSLENFVQFRIGPNEESPKNVASEFLGLDYETTCMLFVPASDLVNYRAVTASIAAGVLDRLALSGEVVWPTEVLR